MCNISFSFSVKVKQVELPHVSFTRFAIRTSIDFLFLYFTFLMKDFFYKTLKRRWWIVTYEQTIEE